MNLMYSAARVALPDDAKFMTKVRKHLAYALLHEGCVMDSIVHKEPEWQDAYVTDDGVEIEAGWVVISTGERP